LASQSVTVLVALPAPILDTTPLSYVNALVNFATGAFDPGGIARVTVDTAKTQNLTLAAVDAAFHQSIADLLDAQNAERANETIHQLRICIEVLRKYLALHPPPPALAQALASAESAYRQAAYFSLLNQIGTSYDEIRLARTYNSQDADDLKNLQALCVRLGIELGPASDPYTLAPLANHLAQLCLAPKGTPDTPLVFRLTVTDSTGATAAATVDLSIYGNDRPLSITAGPNATVNQGDTVSLTSTYADAHPGATIASYAWSQVAGPHVALSNANIPNPTFVAPTVRSDTILRFQLTVTDSAGTTASITTAVIVNGVKSSLLVNAGSSQTVLYNQSAVTLNGGATEASTGATITTFQWSQLAGPPVQLTNPLSKSASFAPPFIVPLLPLTEQSLEQIFGLVDSNRDPFSQGATVSDTQELVAQWNLEGVEWNRATDPDGIAYLEISFSVSGAPSQLNLFSNRGRSVVLASGSANVPGEVTLSPVNNSGVSGRVLISKTGNDALIGLSVFPRFLSWQFQRLRNTWLAQDFPADTLLSFQFTVADSTGAVVSLPVNVTVCHIHRPCATAGPNRTALPGDTVILAGTANPSTSTGAIRAYKWTQLGGLPVTLTNANTATATFVAPAFPVDTQLTFQLTVTDSVSATSTTTVTVTVYHIARLLTSGAGANQTVNHGATVTLTGTAAELNPNATISTFQWTQIAGPAVALSNSGAGATVTFDAPVVTVDTVFTFQVTVTDSTGVSATAASHVTVYGSTHPLTVNAGSTQTVSEGATVTLVGNAAISTVGAVISAYQWTQLAGPTVTLANANNAQASFTAPAVSADTTLRFELTVTDSTGGNATVPVDILVYQIEYPIAVNTGSSQTVNERTLVMLSGSVAVSKSGAGVQSYQWTQVAGPAVILNNAATSTASFIAPSVAPPPIIDPDLLVPGDFKDLQASPYISLYVARQNQIQSWLTTLQSALTSAPTTLGGLNAMLGMALNGKQLSDLQALNQQLEAGVDISAHLEVLALSLAAFQYLLQLATFVEGGQPVLDSEWSDLQAILIQAQKLKTFQSWRSDEVNAQLSLSPDYFNYPPVFPALFSTGLDSNGHTLSDGVPDPHWTITSTPAGPTNPPATASVTNTGFPIGTHWMPNTATSRWISPQANESQGTDSPGLYTYRTTIDLTGYDPASVRLRARIAVDNAVRAVRLNGKDLGLKTRGYTGFSTVEMNGPFQSGMNTLDFVVLNEGTTPNPSGLRVELSFTTPLIVAELPAWRANLQARQAWQDMLSGRISQNSNSIQALQAGQDATEESTLALLRDALVSSCTTSTPIPLFSTGLDGNGNVLSDGAIDPHWINVVPKGESNELLPAYATKTPLPAGWMANTGISRWISPNPNESTGEPPGVYTYQTSFNLTGFDPLSVQVLTKVTADNQVNAFRLNGQDLGLKAAGFSSLIALPAITHDFVLGINVLDVDVQNLGSQPNPSGLHIEFSSSGVLPVSAAWLSERLLIDIQGDSRQKTTRLAQATELMQSLVFALRNHEFKQLAPQPDVSSWTLTEAGGRFDEEWVWIGTYPSWQSIMRVFLYPENTLLPTLRLHASTPVAGETTTEPAILGEKTHAFDLLVGRLESYDLLTSDAALTEANTYLADLRATDSKTNKPLYPSIPPELQAISQQPLQPPPPYLYAPNLQVYPDPRALNISQQRQHSKSSLINYDIQVPTNWTSIAYLWESWYSVPVQIALSLQRSRQFEAALDWFRMVYAYDLPLSANGGQWSDDQRATFYGLRMEPGDPGTFPQVPTWMVDTSNPHQIAVYRPRPYTRFILLSIVQCLLDFADAQFASETSASISEALGLYLRALDMLGEVQQVLPADFVTDANPQLARMRQDAETNLFKVRTGRNVAGNLRAVDGALPQPTAYRYSTLMDRAKQLVTLAQQVEATYLASLEKAASEAYTALKANQDLQTAIATVNLQQSQVQTSTDGVTLAKDQVTKAKDAVDHYNSLISSNIVSLEQASIGLQVGAVALQVAAASVSAAGAANLFDAVITLGQSVTGGVASSLSSLAAAASTSASVLSAGANLEEKQSDWQFGLSQAQDDTVLGNDQVQIANDQLATAHQQLNIANLQASHAQATVNLLANKFTNADLYQWMSGVLGSVYAYFLQQAAALARLAENQLAFERQQKALSIIRPDYWQPVARTNGGGQTSQGLTGAETLLADIAIVDQYAFATDQIKLQITKTISLALLDPFAFQQFTETGVLRFSTPMGLYDRDFPGHYLRLISQVRVSVVALIPPTLGINATLANSGISRVVVQNDLSGFQSVIVQRAPQLIALSSPNHSTGLFPLTTSSQSALLLPFEDLGVDTTWEFTMAKAANPFDYSTIADVQIVIDYTALDSPDYRLQVIQQLHRSISADRAYSFKQQFPDAWYELNNPSQSPSPFTVQVQSQLSDFPPHLEKLHIAQLLLYFIPADEASFQLQPTLQFAQSGTSTSAGGAADALLDPTAPPTYVFSTRRGNASAWIPILGQGVAGHWTLSLPNTLATASIFQKEQIQDILFVITYAGNTPAWPN
jgi:hypothetical protein